MLRTYFDAGGPLMFVLFGAWIIVFAGILDRLLYAAGCAWRRPRRAMRALWSSGQEQEAQSLAEQEEQRAQRGLDRIQSVSHLATSIGLFGTILGIARSFFARGIDVAADAPEALASGLSTALFTTLGGLAVFLVGESFTIAYREWLSFVNRDVALLATHEGPTNHGTRELSDRRAAP